MSSDDAAQQRTTRSPGLQVPPQRWMLGRQLEQVVRHDITDELNEEAAITNAQVQRAEQMCLARNAKNRAKREKKREKMRAATVDALFMPDMSRAVGEAVCEANANEKADAVARRQGAMHGEHEAMAHSLSGYAGRSDDDGYKERARHWLAIMKHFLLTLAMPRPPAARDASMMLTVSWISRMRPFNSSPLRVRVFLTATKRDESHLQQVATGQLPACCIFGTFISRDKIFML